MSFDVHHIQPRSWDGPDIAENRITVCPATHRNAHGVLDLHVKYKGYPPSALLNAYPKFARDLALQGYNKYLATHGNVMPTKYTLDTVHDTEHIHSADDDLVNGDD